MTLPPKKTVRKRNPYTILTITNRYLWLLSVSILKGFSHSFESYLKNVKNAIFRA